MTITCKPYYRMPRDARLIADLFKGILPSGIIKGFGVQADGSAVNPGSLLTDEGVLIESDAALDIQDFAIGDATHPRYDIVVCDYAYLQTLSELNQPLVRVITGTPATPPSIPSVPEHCVLLATCAMMPGASTWESVLPAGPPIKTFNVSDDGDHYRLGGCAAFKALFVPGADGGGALGVWIVSGTGKSDGDEITWGSPILTLDSANGILELTTAISAIRGVGWTDETLTSLKAMIENLAGGGRTIETVKANADNITTLNNSLMGLGAIVEAEHYLSDDDHNGNHKTIRQDGGTWKLLRETLTGDKRHRVYVNGDACWITVNAWYDVGNSLWKPDTSLQLATAVKIAAGSMQALRKASGSASWETWTTIADINPSTLVTVLQTLQVTGLTATSIAAGSISFSGSLARTTPKTVRRVYPAIGLLEPFAGTWAVDTNFIWNGDNGAVTDAIAYIPIMAPQGSKLKTIRLHCNPLSVAVTAQLFKRSVTNPASGTGYGSTSSDASDWTTIVVSLGEGLTVGTDDFYLLEVSTTNQVYVSSIDVEYEQSDPLS